MNKCGRALIISALAVCLSAPAANARLVVTEIMSQSIHAGPTDCDWWELTNTGPASVNLQGYSWDDQNMRRWQNVFTNITIAPGESIILRDYVAAAWDAWKSDWALGPEVHVYDPDYFGGGFSSFGSSDGVFVYDVGGTLVASASYPGRAPGASNAWDADGAYLGISVNGQDGAYRSNNAIPDVASPGYAVSESPSTFAKTLYWTEKNYPNGRIQRINYNGAPAEILLTISDGLNEPRGIAIDVVAEKMYWADTAMGAIYTAGIDGSNVSLFVSGLTSPADIALDAKNNMLYWADIAAGKIQRRNIDSPGPVEDVVTGIVEPYYIDLDLTAAKVYWSDVQSQTIHRANLNGTAVEDFITGLSWVRDIAVDPAGGKIYWGDRQSSKIQRKNLDGTGAIEDLYGPLDNLDRPHGVVLDVKDGKIYWTDTGMYNICRGDMDGSGPVECLVTGLDGPWALFLILPTPDINRDGYVDMADFALFASQWGRNACGPCRGADLTGDYNVRADDLAALADAWLTNP